MGVPGMAVGSERVDLRSCIQWLDDRDTSCREFAAPGIVEALQAQTLANGAIDWTQAFDLGQVTCIADGPFVDFPGTFEHFDAAGRIRGLPDLLGRPISVALREEVLLPAA
jgi:hypothetical protein